MTMQGQESPFAFLREKAGDGTTDFFVEVRQSDLTALLLVEEARQSWERRASALLQERDELVLQNESCGNALVDAEAAFKHLAVVTRIRGADLIRSDLRLLASETYDEGIAERLREMAERV